MSIIPIFIPHAGCPHQCVFCNQKKISGQKIASAQAVREQIKKYLQWVKPGRDNEAAFYGGSFTGLDAVLQEELFAPVDELLRDGVIGSVRCSTRPDYITAEKLALLKKHNLTTVELGVQSLDDKVLALAERGHDAASVTQAVQLLRAYGFNVGLQLMCGMPGQTAASFLATVAQSIDLKPNFVRLYPLLVIKDTPLEESYRRGEFKPLAVEEILCVCTRCLSLRIRRWRKVTAAVSLNRWRLKKRLSCARRRGSSLKLPASKLSAQVCSLMMNCAARAISLQGRFIPLLASLLKAVCFAVRLRRRFCSCCAAAMPK